MLKRFNIQHDNVLTRRQVRDVDAWAISILGIPGVVLMENAGRGCADIIIPELKNRGGKNVCIFCGTGNNGGDGFVIARLLTNAGYKVKIILCGPPAKIKGDALISFNIARNMQIPITEISLTQGKVNEEVAKHAGGSDLIVDAIFGTGLTGELSDIFIEIINAINLLNKPVIAVDIPSGLDCDKGEPIGASIKAIATVTFVASKQGFQNSRSMNYTGDVYIASIGVEP